jgi:HTH-type transcriptional regulator/antitoxin HigA
MPVVIESDDEYQRMLGALEALMDKDDDAMSPEDGRLLTLLAMLIEEYEDRNIPLPRAEPHKMVKYLIEERGLKQKDLWPVVGSKSRVSEILAGKRAITKDQAKNLAAFFHVPVELFI